MLNFTEYAFTQDNIVLSKQKKEILVSPYLEILEIPVVEKKLTIEDILQEKYQRRFQKNQENTPSFGYSSSRFWLKFKVKKEEKSDWLLQISHPFLDYIDFYLISPDGSIIKKKTGGLRAFDKRDFRHHLFLFEMDLKENQVYSVYICIYGNSTKSFPLKLSQKKYYWEEAHQKDIVMGIYFGFYVVMILYNFFLFFSLRSISYLHYVFFIATFLALQFSLQGYIHLFNPFYYPHIANLSSLLFSPLVVITGIFFTKSFLQIKTTLKPALIILHIINLVAIVLFGLGIVSIFYPIFLNFLPALNSYTTLINILALLIIGLLLLLKGYRPARFYMLAWSFLLIGGAIYVLRNSGVLPSNWFTLNALRWGSVLEVLLLSLGLADRFQLAEKAKNEAQNDLISALQKNEKLVVEQNQILEQKVKQRTQELAQKNQDIISSINYAQYIQNAMLPLADDINESLPHNFILYKPRDIISGDFYWYYPFKNYVIIAVADCTGHGVPGAFMSMLGFSLLNQIVIDKKITEPELILQRLHIGISNALNQQKTDNKDGMDISICVIDKSSKILHYAGAKSPLVYIQNQTLSEIKATTTPLGNVHIYGQANYEAHQIPFIEETCFYLFSDGYQDQFGGKNGKKFMKSNFKNLLLEVHQKSFPTQKEILIQRLEDWQGNEFQVDDILVVGFRLGEYF